MKNIDKEKVEQKIEELRKLLGFGNNEWESEDLTYLINAAAVDAIEGIEESHEQGLGYVGLLHFSDTLVKEAGEFKHRAPKTNIHPIGLNSRN
jgi:thermostable 8-oxoguanine DNA glycosylase